MFYKEPTKYDFLILSVLIDYSFFIIRVKSEMIKIFLYKNFNNNLNFSLNEFYFPNKKDFRKLNFVKILVKILQ